MKTSRISISAALLLSLAIGASAEPTPQDARNAVEAAQTAMSDLQKACASPDGCPSFESYGVATDASQIQVGARAKMNACDPKLFTNFVCADATEIQMSNNPAHENVRSALQKDYLEKRNKPLFKALQALEDKQTVSPGGLLPEADQKQYDKLREEASHFAVSIRADREFQADLKKALVDTKEYGQAKKLLDDTKRRMKSVLNKMLVASLDTTALQGDASLGDQAVKKEFVNSTFRQMINAVDRVYLDSMDGMGKCLYDQKGMKYERTDKGGVKVTICPQTLFTAGEEELAAMLGKAVGHSIDSCGMSLMAVGEKPPVSLAGILEPLRACVGRGMKSFMKSQGDSGALPNPAVDPKGYTSESQRLAQVYGVYSSAPQCSKPLTAAELGKKEAVRPRDQGMDAVAYFWSNQVASEYLIEKAGGPSKMARLRYNRAEKQAAQLRAREMFQQQCNIAYDPNGPHADPKLVLQQIIAADPDIRFAMGCSVANREWNSMVAERTQYLREKPVAAKAEAGYCDAKFFKGFQDYFKGMNRGALKDWSATLGSVPSTEKPSDYGTQASVGVADEKAGVKPTNLGRSAVEIVVDGVTYYIKPDGSIYDANGKPVSKEVSEKVKADLRKRGEDAGKLLEKKPGGATKSEEGDNGFAKKVELSDDGKTRKETFTAKVDGKERKVAEITYDEGTGKLKEATVEVDGKKYTIKADGSVVDANGKPVSKEEAQKAVEVLKRVKELADQNPSSGDSPYSKKVELSTDGKTHKEAISAKVDGKEKKIADVTYDDKTGKIKEATVEVDGKKYTVKGDGSVVDANGKPVSKEEAQKAHDALKRALENTDDQGSVSVSKKSEVTDDGKTRKETINANIDGKDQKVAEIAYDAKDGKLKEAVLEIGGKKYTVKPDGTVLDENGKPLPKEEAQQIREYLERLKIAAERGASGKTGPALTTSGGGGAGGSSSGGSNSGSNGNSGASGSSSSGGSKAKEDPANATGDNRVPGTVDPEKPISDPRAVSKDSVSLRALARAAAIEQFRLKCHEKIPEQLGWLTYEKAKDHCDAKPKGTTRIDLDLFAQEERETVKDFTVDNGDGTRKRVKLDGDGYTFAFQCQMRCYCGTNKCFFPEVAYKGQTQPPIEPKVANNSDTRRDDLRLGLLGSSPKVHPVGKACLLTQPIPAVACANQSGMVTQAGPAVEFEGELSGQVLTFGCQHKCACGNGSSPSCETEISIPDPEKNPAYSTNDPVRLNNGVKPVRVKFTNQGDYIGPMPKAAPSQEGQGGQAQDGVTSRVENKQGSQVQISVTRSEVPPSPDFKKDEGQFATPATPIRITAESRVGGASSDTAGAIPVPSEYMDWVAARKAAYKDAAAICTEHQKEVAKNMEQMKRHKIGDTVPTDIVIPTPTARFKFVYACTYACKVEQIGKSPVCTGSTKFQRQLEPAFVVRNVPETRAVDWEVKKDNALRLCMREALLTSTSGKVELACRKGGDIVKVQSHDISFTTKGELSGSQIPYRCGFTCDCAAKICSFGDVKAERMDRYFGEDEIGSRESSGPRFVAYEEKPTDVNRDRERSLRCLSLVTREVKHDACANPFYPKVHGKNGQEHVFIPILVPYAGKEFVMECPQTCKR